MVRPLVLKALIPFLVLGVPQPAGSQPAAANNQPAGKTQKPVRTDLDGDSLPEGAVARLGKGGSSDSVAGERPTLMVFSPTAKSLAAGRRDRSVVIWDLVTQKSKLVLPGHFEAVRCVSYSPDGKIIATVDGADGTDDREAQIRLWDADDGRLLRQFFGHLNGVHSLAFSTDGKKLVSGGGDARARLWDVGSGKQLHQARGAESDKNVRFTPDGQAFLVADVTGGGMTLWRADTGQKLRDLPSANEEAGAILGAAFLPDGKRLAAVELVMTIQRDEVTVPRRERVPEISFWNYQTGHLLRSVLLSVPAASLRCSALANDGRTFALGIEHDPSIHLWDADSGKLLGRLRGQAGEVLSLAFSPDGKWLASGSADGTILLWNLLRSRQIGLWFRLGGDANTASLAVQSFVSDPANSVSFLRECLQRAVALEAEYLRLIADLDDNQFKVREEASRRLEAAPDHAELALRLGLQSRPSLELRRRIEQILSERTSNQARKIQALIQDFHGDRAKEAHRQLEALGPESEPALRLILHDQVSPTGDEKNRSPAAWWTIQRLLVRSQEPEGGKLIFRASGVLRALEALVKIGTPDARRTLAGLAKGPAESRIVHAAKAALARLPNEQKSR